MYKVECELKPTENPSHLLKSLGFFFPETEFTVSKNSIVGESDLVFFRKVSAEQESSAVLDELDANGSVCLDKLAMDARVISPDEGFPLGCVRIVRE